MTTSMYHAVVNNFVSLNLILNPFFFQTRALPESHTGINIAGVLREAVNEWRLPPDPPLK